MFWECLDTDVLVGFDTADIGVVRCGFNYSLGGMMWTGCMGSGASGFEGVLGDEGVCDDGGGESRLGGRSGGWGRLLSGVRERVLSEEDVDNG